MKSIFLILAVLVLLPSVAADWPVHRYDFTHQGFDPTNNNFAVFQQEWWSNVSIPATVKASPIVSEGRVFIGGWDKFLYALDSESGSVLWKIDLKAKISSTAAASESTVYAVTETGSLYAIEARTGAIERQTTIGATFGTITVHERRIFVGASGGKVSAYEGDNFELVWTFQLKPPKWQTGPPGSATCEGIDVGGEVEGAPVIYQGNVFFGSTNQWFYAVNEQGNGNLTTNPVWCFKASGAIRNGAAIDKVNGRLLFGAMDGKMYSVSLSGSVAWTAAHFQGGTGQTTPSQIQSAPAIAYNKAFYGVNNGEIVAASLSDGVKVWSHLTGGQVVSSPAVANHSVVVGSADRTFYMLNQSTGAVLWTKTASRAIETSPAISGTQAFWGSTDGGLYSWGGTKPPRADLEVSAISGSFAAGQSGTLSATVKNIGTLKSEAADVQFFDGSKLITTARIAALEPGKSEKVSTSYAPAKAFTARVVVDPTNAVRELSEGNNILEKKLSVAAAPASGSGASTSGGGSPDVGPILLILTLLGVGAVVRRRRE